MLTSRKTVSTRVVCPWWVHVSNDTNLTSAISPCTFVFSFPSRTSFSCIPCGGVHVCSNGTISVSFRSLSPPRSLTKSEFKNLILALLEWTFLTIFHYRHILLSHRSRFLCSLVTFSLDLVCVYHIPAEKHHSNRRLSQQHNQNAAGQDTATKTRPNAL